MCPRAAERVSELLLNWGQGDQHAREELISLVYGELRRIARRFFWQEHPEHTLQNGSFVHKASSPLVHHWHNGAQYLGVDSHAWLQRELTQKEVRR